MSLREVSLWQKRITYHFWTLSKVSEVSEFAVIAEYVDIIHSLRYHQAEYLVRAVGEVSVQNISKMNDIFSHLSKMCEWHDLYINKMLQVVIVVTLYHRCHNLSWLSFFVTNITLYLGCNILSCRSHFVRDAHFARNIKFLSHLTHLSYVSQF